MYSRLTALTSTNKDNSTAQNHQHRLPGATTAPDHAAAIMMMSKW